MHLRPAWSAEQIPGQLKFHPREIMYGVGVRREGGGGGADLEFLSNLPDIPWVYDIMSFFIWC